MKTESLGVRGGVKDGTTEINCRVPKKNQSGAQSLKARMKARREFFISVTGGCLFCFYCLEYYNNFSN